MSRENFRGNGVDMNSIRLNRRKQTIELRKARKEKRLRQQRIISEKDKNDAFDEAFHSIKDIVNAMRSPDYERRLQGTQAARKRLSRRNYIPIDEFIERGILPICLKLIQNCDHPDLQYEALWILTNISTGTSMHTRCVIESGALPYLVGLMRSQSPNIAELAVWVLANIVSDGPCFRDIVIQHQVVDAILTVANTSVAPPLTFLRKFVWLIVSLFAHKNPRPPFEEIRRMLPLLTQMLSCQDRTVVAEACWGFSYVTDGSRKKVRAVLDAGALPLLVKFLGSRDTRVIVPALRSIGNIVLGRVRNAGALIELNGLPKLAALLQHPSNQIAKEALWVVSNIASDNQEHIEAILEAGILTQIRKILEKGSFQVKAEAVWIVRNVISHGTVKQIDYMLEKQQLLKPFCDLMAGPDASTTKVVLEGIANILELAAKLGVTEVACRKIEEVDGLEKLEALQEHENRAIYKQAYEIMDKYFESDEVDVTREEENGTLEFNADQPPEGSCSS